MDINENTSQVNIQNLSLNPQITNQLSIIPQTIVQKYEDAFPMIAKPNFKPYNIIISTPESFSLIKNNFLYLCQTLPLGNHNFLFPAQNYLILKMEGYSTDRLGLLDMDAQFIPPLDEIKLNKQYRVDCLVAMREIIFQEKIGVCYSFPIPPQKIYSNYSYVTQHLASNWALVRSNFYFSILLCTTLREYLFVVWLNNCQITSQKK